MNIQNDKNICPNAKLIYNQIVALSKQTGYCYASKEWFAKNFQYSDRTVNRWISRLVARGYITRSVKKIGTKIISQNLIAVGGYAFGNDSAPSVSATITPTSSATVIPTSSAPSVPTADKTITAVNYSATATPSVSAAVAQTNSAPSAPATSSAPGIPATVPPVNSAASAVSLCPKMSESSDKNVPNHSLEKNKYINNNINIHTDVKNYTIPHVCDYVSKFADFMTILESASPSFFRKLILDLDEKSKESNGRFNKLIADIEYNLRRVRFSTQEILKLFNHAESTWFATAAARVGAGWVLLNSKRVFTEPPISAKNAGVRNTMTNTAADNQQQTAKILREYEKNLHFAELKRESDREKAMTFPEFSALQSEYNALIPSLADDADEKMSEIRQKQTDLLKKLNIDNFFEIKHTCEKCKDTGYDSGKLCQCVKDRLTDDNNGGANNRPSSPKTTQNFTQREYSKDELDNLFIDLNTTDKLEL
jgi:hypothetical protein